MFFVFVVGVIGVGVWCWCFVCCILETSFHSDDSYCAMIKKMTCCGVWDSSETLGVLARCGDRCVGPVWVQFAVGVEC